MGSIHGFNVYRTVLQPHKQWIKIQQVLGNVVELNCDDFTDI